MPSPRPAPTPPEERLSAQLRIIAQRCEKETVSLGELLNALRGSPYLLLTALLSLLFLPPLPLFWLAPIAGIPIALFGLHMALGIKPIIPARLRDLKLPHKTFPLILKATSRMLRTIEFVSRPRWRLLTGSPLLMNLYGIIIMLTALILTPPLPIPFWHFMPALTLFLLSLGLIERDGLFILMGILSFAATLMFVSLLCFYGHKLIERFF